MRDLSHYCKLEPFAKTLSGNLDVSCKLKRVPSGLALTYVVAGELSALRIPQANEFGGDDLWAHTCAELFARLPGQREYWEWNFSPNGQWNFFTFSDYRQRNTLATRGTGGVQSMAWTQANTELRAEILLERAPSPLLDWALETGAPLEMSATMVLEGTDKKIEYRAAKHAAAKADFHDARSFIICL
ncbi:MAG: hypothetical protein JST16_03305 [Bdellovibrionales bacterium]|nr:hypothetical protein [Bdellovibrionales bacterium]